MFGSLGFTELVLILIIVLIIFGAGKLPQLGEGVGKAIKGFKKSVHEAEAIDTEAQTMAEQPNPAPAQQPMSAEVGQVPPDPSQVSPQVAPASSSVQGGTVAPGQIAQPEPRSTSKV